jgi:hypothetical protein
MLHIGARMWITSIGTPFRIGHKIQILLDIYLNFKCAINYFEEISKNEFFRLTPHLNPGAAGGACVVLSTLFLCRHRSWVEKYFSSVNM